MKKKENLRRYSKRHILDGWVLLRLLLFDTLILVKLNVRGCNILSVLFIARLFLAPITGHLLSVVLDAIASLDYISYSCLA